MKKLCKRGRERKNEVKEIENEKIYVKERE